MKRVLWVIEVIFYLIFINSCNKDTELLLDLDVSDSQKDEMIERLDMDTENLTVADAELVANLFNRDNITRSGVIKTVKNSVIIEDGTGEAAIYAVNFNEDGYLLISATTKYFPILAVIDHGEYSYNMPETGQQVVISDMIGNIRIAKEDEYDFDCKSEWLRFMDLKPVSNKTRASDDEFSDAYTDSYWEVFWDWYDSHSDENSRIIKLVDCKNILPDKVYAEFVSAAQSEDLWEGTQFSWQNTAYIVEKTTEDIINIGPLIKTHWGQSGKFNTSGYETLGCVTVATGQLMKYFEFPEYYDWKNMPDGLVNSTITNFLSSLRSELDVSAGGSASIGDAERVLKNKGYVVSKNDHDVTKLYNDLRNNKCPVYARGAKGFLQSGHAWVIDGLSHHSTNIKYTLYRLTDVAYPDFRYDNAEAADPYNDYSSYTLFHMNWGWSGDYDGWFYDQNIAVTRSDGTYNFSYDRKEMYINRP